MKPLRRNIMKNLWLNKSKQRFGVLSSLGCVFSLGMFVMSIHPLTVQADEIDDALLCLEQANLPCATEIASKMYSESPTNTDVLQLELDPFHLGILRSRFCVGSIG